MLPFLPTCLSLVVDWHNWKQNKYGLMYFYYLLTPMLRNKQAYRYLLSTKFKMREPTLPVPNNAGCLASQQGHAVEKQSCIILHPSLRLYTLLYCLIFENFSTFEEYIFV